MIRCLGLAAISWAVGSIAWAGGGHPGLVPESLRVDIVGNQVIEPNEAASVNPSWRNVSPVGGFVGAVLDNFLGPAAATHLIIDGSGGYAVFGGSPAPPASCSDCYVVQVTAPTRPVQHWDATVLETPCPQPSPWSCGAPKTWTLHIGNTFADVPTTSPFYRFVETIVHKNITGGCTATGYCPAAPVSREAMAVFLLVAREPQGYVPPACGAAPLFADVPVSSPYCRWVEELARRGIAGGCGAGNYCPSAAVNRQEMAVFLLAGGPAPQACAGDPFLDVPAASPFCPWIRDLVTAGVTAGCGNGNYCPVAPVTREQMSVFLTTRFALTLYGL